MDKSEIDLPGSGTALWPELGMGWYGVHQLGMVWCVVHSSGLGNIIKWRSPTANVKWR